MKSCFSIFVSAFALLLVGCFRDDLVSPGSLGVGDAVEVTVSVPGPLVPDTRGIGGSGGEAVVAELDVLVFEKTPSSGPELLAERAKGVISEQSSDGGEKYRVTFKVKLTENPDATTIAVIANASDALDTTFGTLPSSGIGSEKQDVLSALTFFNSEAWNTNSTDSGTDYDAIPMYGEKSLTTAGIVGGLKIDALELLRMVARIDVVNSATADFTVSDVMLVNRNSGGYIAPAWDPANGKLISPPPAPP